MTVKGPDANDIMREHGPDRLREYLDNHGHAFNGAQRNGETLDTAYEARCLAGIAPEQIKWLWYRRMALGKLNLIAGHPGVAKSQITQFMAATVSYGGVWPDGSPCAKGSVVIVSCEDDAADTIAPRLQALGADRNRIYTLDWVYREGIKGERTRHLFDLGQDVDALTALVRDLGDVALIVIDPISAYMGGLDSHKTSDVRGALAPLQDLAAQSRAAVVLVAHLNKGGVDVNAMARVSGSMAFVAACRSAWLVEFDPKDHNHQRRILTPLKNNIGDDRTGFAFSVEAASLPGGIETSRVVFDADSVEISAYELLSAKLETEADRGALGEATDFLRAYLSDGQKNAKAAYKAAEEAGVSKRTLDRARRQLKVRALKSKGTGYWVWVLPEQECQGDLS